MRNAIVRFPLGRADAVATATPRLRAPLTCRWQINPATGRLEQVWAVTTPPLAR